MKIQILLSLVFLPMLANAEDPYRLDPLAVNLDGGLSKPLKADLDDCTLKPLTYDSSRRQDERGANREIVPEKCVITTYSIPEPGGPDYSLSNIKTIIDYDPRTGDGKVYAADMFGKNEQVGVVKKQTYSDNLIVYPATIFGNADYLKPSQVIEGIERPLPRMDIPGCERRDGVPRTTSSNAKIYQSDDLGRRALFDEPVGNAKVECQK